ncbi:MAG: hypothetical protein ACTHM0_10290 [Sphingomonas sp.]
MNNKGFAFGGAAILVVGLFTPIVTLPFLGSVNLFNNGTNVLALCLLALAAIAAGLTLKDRVRDVIWPGIASAAVLIYYFVRLQYTLSQMRSAMSQSLRGNPFAGIAQTALSSIQLQWGWIVLALGAGLLIYAAFKQSRDEGSGLFSLHDGTGKAIAAVSIIIAVIAAGWNYIGKGTSEPKPAASIGNALSDTSTTDTPSTEATGTPTAEEAAYIRDNVKLYDLTAKYYDSYDGRTPGVDFKIKNEGNRTLNEVDVRVVFYDKDGKPIDEENYTPVLVSEYSMGDNKPLRPNYIWQNDPDQFYTAKGVPSEWAAGKATATVTGIEFASDSKS